MLGSGTPVTVGTVIDALRELKGSRGISSNVELVKRTLVRLIAPPWVNVSKLIVASVPLPSMPWGSPTRVAKVKVPVPALSSMVPAVKSVSAGGKNAPAVLLPFPCSKTLGVNASSNWKPGLDHGIGHPILSGLSYSSPWWTEGRWRYLNRLRNGGKH